MIFLDCEFNGHNGRLISMAMVSNLTDREFYEVLPIPHTEKLVPWVEQNVIPILNKPAISEDVFREKITHFLLTHSGEPVAADSPADFRYLCDYLHHLDADEKYMYLNIELIMMLVVPNRLHYWPENPLEHNALSDAKTLLKWHDWRISDDNLRNRPSA